MTSFRISENTSFASKFFLCIPRRCGILNQNNRKAGCTDQGTLLYAGMMELADMRDLGSRASALGFESPCPHQRLCGRYAVRRDVSNCKRQMKNDKHSLRKYPKLGIAGGYAIFHYRIKCVAMGASRSGRPYFSLPRAILLIRNAMFFASVRMVCLPSPS